MARFWRVGSLVPAITALAVIVSAGSLYAQKPALQTTRTDCDDYGAGGHRETDADSTGAVLEGRVYDEHGTLREKETDEYSAVDGPKHRTEKELWDFTDKGALSLKVDYKFDLHGGLSYIDQTHYGLHGQRTWEQIVDYKTDGYERDEWNSVKHTWTDEFHAYKFDTPKPGAALQPLYTPGVPTNTDIGVIFPSDFHPGDDIIGTLVPVKYADAFKTVPGLAEYHFPLQCHHLPDGTPQLSGLEVGVKGYGYTPVSPNGEFSLHIPLSFKGPLELQALQPDSIPGIGPSHGFFGIGDPVDAPKLPKGLVSHQIDIWDEFEMTSDLIDLWNEAFDLENDLDEYYATHENTNNESVWEMKDDLDEVYDDIDALTRQLPTEMVTELARGLAKKNRDINDRIVARGNLTDAQKAEVQEYDGWARFLEDEAHAAAENSMWGPLRSIEPYWTTPVLTQGKLGALRGSFSGDPCDRLLHIDNYLIRPLAATPNAYYFLPPDGLTSGLHDYTFDSPGYPETILPFFYMTLTMWADALNLHKGQSTTYHVKLDGVFGLPGSAWNAPFYQSDLISSSEWNAPLPGGQSAASSPTGSITLSVTNQSPGTISMLNTYATLDAKLFAPSGSYQQDGGVGAIMDGTFSILGVARAYLTPEVGLGAPSGSSGTPSYAPPVTDWTPSGGWNYIPTLPAGTDYKPDCSSPASSHHCMGATANGIYDHALGYPSSTTVDNPPKEKSQFEPWRREGAAQKKADDAEADLKKKQAAADSAWDNAVDHLPAAMQDEYKKRVERARKAEDEYGRTSHEFDLATKDGSVRVPPEIIGPKYDAWERAKEERESSTRSLERYRREMMAKFTKADRDAWEAAQAKAEAAESAAAKAEAELRDARADRENAEKYQKPLTPDEPRVPIG